MLGLVRKSRMEKVKDALKVAVAYTDDLIRDERLRSDLRSAVGHGVVATQRMQEESGLSGLTVRLAGDKKLRKNLRSLLDDLDSAGGRVRRKRGHRVRNMLLIAGGSGVALAAVPDARRWVANHLSVSHNGGAGSLATAE